MRCGAGPSATCARTTRRRSSSTSREEDGAQELRAELHGELGKHQQEPAREDASFGEDRQEDGAAARAADRSAAAENKEESDQREQQSRFAAAQEVQVDAVESLQRLEVRNASSFDTAGRERLRSRADSLGCAKTRIPVVTSPVAPRRYDYPDSTLITCSKILYSYLSVTVNVC